MGGYGVAIVNVAVQAGSAITGGAALVQAAK